MQKVCIRNNYSYVFIQSAQGSMSRGLAAYGLGHHSGDKKLPEPESMTVWFTMLNIHMAVHDFPNNCANCIGIRGTLTAYGYVYASYKDVANIGVVPGLVCSHPTWKTSRPWQP